MPRPGAWGDTLLAPIIASATKLPAVNLLTTLENHDTKTVVRLVVRLKLTTDDVGQNSLGYQLVDLGIGVCSAEAFVDDSVPDVQVASDVPQLGWMFRTRVAVIHEQTNVIWDFPLIREDLRASRKVDRGVCYLTAFNTAVQGAPFSVRVVGIIRAYCLV